MCPYLSKKDEKMLYWILVGILTLGAVIYLFLRCFDLSIRLPMCALLRFTGLYCPGCGGTRAFVKLLQGKLWDSFYFHPVVLYGACVGGWYVISHTIEYISKGRWNVGMRYRDIYLYIAIALILVHWFTKNLFWLIGGIRLI